MAGQTCSRMLVVDIDLAEPVQDRGGFTGYERARVLARLHREPIALVDVALDNGTLRADTFLQALLREHGSTCARLLACRALLAGELPETCDPAPLARPLPPPVTRHPLVTVVVCTRDRAGDLARCLDALLALDYPNLDLLVVDNAPRTDATQMLVRERYPRVRCVTEPRPGLDWARNRGLLESRGEIIAYTDDDVIVDPHWVSALVRVFEADETVAAVTGLVVPYELETAAQQLFETYGGFGRGFRRRWFQAASGRPAALEFGGAGSFGTGANMAYRRRVFDLIGGFDPALDVGTCANGGGDLEFFFRVVKEGHTLVYEPSAIVRHRHRRSYEQLRTQIANNGIGFYAYLVRTWLAYPEERLAIVRFGAWWFRYWSLRRLARKTLGLEKVPLALIVVELLGSIRGLFRYRRARRHADMMAAAYPTEPTFPTEPAAHGPRARRFNEAIRRIDISEPVEAITDAGGYRRVRVFVFWRGTPVGYVVIDHDGGAISALRLEDAIVERLFFELLDLRGRVGEDRFWRPFVAALFGHFAGHPVAAVSRAPAAGREPLPDDVSVSVVLATRDRPHDLRACLASLTTQKTARPVEIVVVDNNPSSGLTREVVEDFPGVVLVSEPRPGLSYARNCGILAASGSILATTDDDVACPPDWLENLVRPFRAPEVMVVTGNVLPAQLDTPAQLLFEVYGGLGRGFAAATLDAKWFARWRRSVPTWQLGCTANAAFRASIFSHPRIGLMDESLGAGTPTGCSEDTYVFYRVLKAGYAVAYEPRAYVWHRHRSTMDALRRQIYDYSKGHVAYHLLTWLVEGDVRALIRLGYELPVAYVRRIALRLRRRSDYPLNLIGLEIAGNLAGPWALWQSRRRVRRLGRSRAASPDAPVESKRVMA